MNYLDLTIKEIHNALLEKKVTVTELTKEAIKRAKENKDNAFELILEDEPLKKAKELDELPVPVDNLLFGIPFISKDNFSTKDIETTGSSNILNGYIPLFNATVIDKLLKANAILIGKATLDELAMGGTGTSGHKGTTYNPYDKTHSHLIGGSSCGSAVSVASAIVPFSLGSDTGDSVRKPANNAGLVGFKPTWGRISRFGLFPFAPSLDHVAYFTRDVFDSAYLLNILAGHDDKDSTSSLEKVDDYTAFSKDIKGKRFAVIKEIEDSINDEVLNKRFKFILKELENKGAIIERVSIDKRLLESIYPSYFVISCAEATSNNANLDGIKFGPYYGGKTYQEVMFNARTNGFSNLIKRRFVIGSYALMRENQHDLFLRAQKARRIITNKFNEVLNKYDYIINLASPSVAPEIGKASDKLSNEYLIADNYLAFANFGGQPSITLPIGFKDDLPFGVNVTSKIFTELNLFTAANAIEEITGFSNLSVNNYKNKEEK